MSGLIKQFKEHPALGYGIASALVVGALIVILVINFVFTPDSTGPEITPTQSTNTLETSIDTSELKGLSNVAFLPDKGLAFLQGLKDYLQSTSLGWPCPATILAPLNVDDTQADIYVRLDGVGEYVLCTWRAANSTPYAYSSVTTLPTELQNNLEYSDVGIPEMQQPEELQGSEASAPGEQPAQQGQSPTSTSESPKNEVAASDWQTLSQYLPQEAACRLAQDITTYLSGKGISANGTQAQVDLNSFTTSSSLIQFSARVNDSSGASHTLSIEWNKPRNSFGMSLN